MSEAKFEDPVVLKLQRELEVRVTYELRAIHRLFSVQEGYRGWVATDGALTNFELDGRIAPLQLRGD